MFNLYINWVLGRKYLVLILVVLAAIYTASGVRFLTFSNDYQMFFSEDNPQLLAYEEIQNTYTKTDNVLFVLAPKNGQVFTNDTLAAVEWLTKESWQIPFSLRVDSITNYQHTSADGDDLLVEDLVLNPKTLTKDQLLIKRDIAVAEPLLVNRLISKDASHTGINVTLQFPQKDLSEIPQVNTFVKKMATEFTSKYPNVDIRLTGLAIMNNAFPEASKSDMQTLYPTMFVLVLVFLMLMLRSIPATISSALVIILTIASTMGLASWLGIVLSPPSTSVPVIVMTIAVADCVHILVSFLQNFRLGKSRFEAMKESLRINLMPVFLTSLTTIIGFLSLNFSDAPPFRDLGNMAAMGVMLAFLLSVLLLPALMMILPVSKKPMATRGTQAMNNLAEFVIRNKTKLFWINGLIIIIFVMQIPRNSLNDEFVKYFDETISFRVDTEYAVEHLTGIYRIEYSLGAGGDGQVTSPQYLKLLEDFANWYRAQPRVLHVNVLTDIMKRLNKNMYGDDPDEYKIPEDPKLAAQYLLLYEFSLPYGLDLNNQVNLDKSATRMTVTLENVSSEELLLQERLAQKWLNDNAPEYFKAAGTSPAIMFANIGHRNINSMLKGSTIALITISLILIVALRSVRIGLISIIPNLVPIGVAFGLWGMLVGQVGLALSVVSGVTIGIVVDDTVHFLSKYLRAKREQGLSSEDAVRYAFSTVGTALWVTSLVLAIGFSVLAFSHFELNAGMGLLTAMTIGIALAADFLFLPTLLMKFGDK